MSLPLKMALARPLLSTSGLLVSATSSRKLIPILTKGLRGQNLKVNACQNQRVVSGSITSHLSIWSLLRKFGIPHCKIIWFRRKMKKIYHASRLSTFVAGAIPIIVGDLLAQTVYPRLLLKKKPDSHKKPPSEYAFKIKDINWCRTSHFALIGAFLVGPFSKKWNFFWGTRVRRYPPSAFMTRIVLLDVFLLTPLAVVTYMAGYDYRYIMNQYKDLSSDTAAVDKIGKRYATPLTDMLLFYVMTKPLVVLATCFLIPKSFRNLSRKLYTFIFHCFVSHSIVHAKLGPEITKRRYLLNKDGKKAVKEGSGGLVCMAVDKIFSGSPKK